MYNYEYMFPLLNWVSFPAQSFLAVPPYDPFRGGRGLIDSVTMTEIEGALRSFKKDKSPGPDG